jgi:uncharacterized cupin superfamily protein
LYGETFHPLSPKEFVTMATLEKKSFDNPDETKAPEKTLAQTVNFGTVAATRITVQPGWSWSSCIKPHVGGDSCQAGHVGMVLKGSLRCRHDDGTEIVVTAGDAYSFAPGHDGWVEGDEEAVLYEFNNTGKTYAVWEQA